MTTNNKNSQFIDLGAIRFLNCYQTEPKPRNLDINGYRDKELLFRKEEDSRESFFARCIDVRGRDRGFCGATLNVGPPRNGIVLLGVFLRYAEGL